MFLVDRDDIIISTSISTESEELELLIKKGTKHRTKQGTSLVKGFVFYSGYCILV